MIDNYIIELKATFEKTEKLANKLIKNLDELYKIVDKINKDKHFNPFDLDAIKFDSLNGLDIYVDNLLHYNRHYINKIVEDLRKL